MNYQFYVKLDEQEFGPYSLNEIQELPLLDDTLVTESRLNGEWRPACEFDFKALSDVLNERKFSSTKQASTSTSDSSQKSQEVNSKQEPPILNLWNWGAFALPWIWGIFNGIYWPLIIIALNFIPYAGPFLGFAMCIYLGVCGNKLAWNKAKKIDTNSERFTHIQGKWNIAGIIVFVLSIMLALFVGLLYATKI